MKRAARRRIAEEAALLMAEGAENEYLDAKQRAMMMLGISGRMPSNRLIKECVTSITKTQLGEAEVKKRIREMRTIAEQIMTVLEESYPFLIGSALTGQIRNSSDIDLHAYSDDPGVLVEQLKDYGYTEIDEEHVENRKGSFLHLRWYESIYPVEITVYSWSWRDLILYSSVTGKPMKRADLQAVKKLLAQKPQSDKSS